MKIRNGFVSNSSSSSFMIAIGVITDWFKFKKWYDEVIDLCDWSSDLQVFSSENLPENGYEVEQKGDRIITVGAVNSEPAVAIKKDHLKDRYQNISDNERAKILLLKEHLSDIVVFNIGNDEGDYSFQDNDFGELNYDIGLDHFQEWQRKIYTEFSEHNGIGHVDKMFGAGRNG
jgi:hypothetical protein